MIKKLVSITKVSAWIFLAMNCISCAHQSTDTTLMIDKDAPSNEHVWSETRDVQETVADREVDSEESQLEAIAQEEKSEDNTSELQSGLNDNKSELESEVATNSENSEKTSVSDSFNSGDNVSEALNTPMIVAKSESAKEDEQAPTSEEAKTETVFKDERSEGSREVSSEPSRDELTPPSQVEPTIGVPNELKNNHDRVPTKKPSQQNQSLNSHKQTEVVASTRSAKVTNQNVEPSIDLTSEAETLERVAPKPAEPKMNALGEEEDSSPQLASVEIANFIQRHWLATIIFALGFIGVLYFVMGRKRAEDSQSI